MIIRSDFHQWFSFSIKFSLDIRKSLLLATLLQSVEGKIIECVFWLIFQPILCSNLPKTSSSKCKNIFETTFAVEKNLGKSLLNQFYFLGLWQITKMHLISFGWCFTGLCWGRKMELWGFEHDLYLEEAWKRTKCANSPQKRELMLRRERKLAKFEKWFSIVFVKLWMFSLFSISFPSFTVFYDVCQVFGFLCWHLCFCKRLLLMNSLNWLLYLLIHALTSFLASSRLSLKDRFSLKMFLLLENQTKAFKQFFIANISKVLAITNLF